MPRLVVPRTRVARRQAERRRDHVVLALKVTTFLVAVGVFGAFVLLANTDELDPADAPPAAAERTPRLAQNEPRLRLPAANTAATSIVPTVTSETPEPPPPETTPEETTDPGDSPDGFVRQGTPCDRPGDYGFTERYRPVVCYPAGQSATWQYMF